MIERYRDLFINRDDVYARQSDDGQAYFCIREPLTDRVLGAHLRGMITCGFYALNQDNKVKWAVVDIDEETGVQTAQIIHRRLAELELPSYIEQSRAGRAHLWLFTPPWPAKPIRFLMHSVVDDEQIEIFPKQEEISPGRVGSLVRGPLGIHRKTNKRYLFLDPETLERVDDSPSYLSKMQRGEGSQLATALNELMREGDKKPPAVREPVIYNPSVEDTLAVAQTLNIPLQRRDHYYQGICPLHPGEKHPSFTIYPNTNVWICWHGPQVGQGGVSLLAAVQGISLAQADEILKERL